MIKSIRNTSKTSLRETHDAIPAQVNTCAGALRGISPQRGSRKPAGPERRGTLPPPFIKKTSYEYGVENRLKAIREGGRVLMAVSYDGDGNRVFGIERKQGSYAKEAIKGKAGYESATSDPKSGEIAFHNGIDFAVPVGTPVYAVKDEIVTVVHINYGTTGLGCYVVIDHGDGMTTRYAHNSKLLVTVGQFVRQGEQIAESGNTGKSTGPHSHFEVWINGNPKNPKDYL